MLLETDRVPQELAIAANGLVKEREHVAATHPRGSFPGCPGQLLGGRARVGVASHPFVVVPPEHGLVPEGPVELLA